MPDPSQALYPLSALIGDYLRALIGLTVCTGLAIGPLWGLDIVSPLLWIFGGLACCFFLFFARTLMRQNTKITVTDTELIRAGWQPQTLSWSEIQHVSLRYYGLRSGWGWSGRRSGKPVSKTYWMELELKAPQGRIQIDSALPLFGDIVAKAAICIQTGMARGNDITKANLIALGLLTNDGFNPFDPKNVADRI